MSFKLKDNLFWVGTRSEYDDAVDAGKMPEHTIVFITDETADYVVDIGTSGEWTYRKWNSGIAECWRQTGSYSEAMTNNYGNGNYYTTDYFGFPPNLFASVKYVDVHRVGGNGVGLVSTSVYSYSTTRVDLYIWNNGSSLTTNLAFSIHAIGTWK